MSIVLTEPANSEVRNLVNKIESVKARHKTEIKEVLKPIREIHVAELRPLEDWLAGIQKGCKHPNLQESENGFKPVYWSEFCPDCGFRNHGEDY